MKHEPTILGLIKTKRNFWLAEQTMKPLWWMVQATLNSQAKVKLVTSSCFEEHTARNSKNPAGSVNSYYEKFWVFTSNLVAMT
jgi:hypothetical protein